MKLTTQMTVLSANNEKTGLKYGSIQIILWGFKTSTFFHQIPGKVRTGHKTD